MHPNPNQNPYPNPKSNPNPNQIDPRENFAKIQRM